MTDKGQTAQWPSGPRCDVGWTNGNGGPAGPSGPTQWNGTVCLPQIRCRPGGAHSHYRVHPGVKMFRTQPVADGPADPDRTRRPVGTDEVYAVHDEVRPTAGGPVGRFPNPGPLKSSKMPSPDDSYQPLVTGPLGTNEMYAINNPGRPMAGGPLVRPFSLDPMGPR